MPPATIHIIGDLFTGTCYEASVVVGIASANMGRRIAKYKAGEYTAEKCMAVGTISRRSADHTGTPEWMALSNHVKDARLQVEDVKEYWEAIQR